MEKRFNKGETKVKKKILIGVAAIFCVAISVALGASILMGYRTYEAVKKQNALLQAVEFV